jgi:hypothetical protein
VAPPRCLPRLGAGAGGGEHLVARHPQRQLAAGDGGADVAGAGGERGFGGAVVVGQDAGALRLPLGAGVGGDGVGVRRDDLAVAVDGTHRLHPRRARGGRQCDGGGCGQGSFHGDCSCEWLATSRASSRASSRANEFAARTTRCPPARTAGLPQARNSGIRAGASAESPLPPLWGRGRGWGVTLPPRRSPPSAPNPAQAIVTRRAETRRLYRGAPFAQARLYRAYANRARWPRSGHAPEPHRFSTA